AAFVVAFARHHVNFQVADVADARQAIEFHISIEHPAGFGVIDCFFEETVGNAHDERAIDLALGGFQVDDQTAVLDGDHFVNRDDAGLDIDRNVGHLRAPDAAADQSRLSAFSRHTNAAFCDRV